MSIRKLFWNIGGKLPVWMIHPGQIILLIERKLGATLFKGATLPAWWTSGVMPTAILLSGTVVSVAASVGLVFWVADLMGGTVENPIENLGAVGLFFMFGALVVCGAAMSWRLATIWPWRHLRVAVYTVGEKRAACKIAREPCAFKHVDGAPAQGRHVHWFWGPTLGSRDWKFRFLTHAEPGHETTHSFMVVSDRTGASMSFTIHEMTDIDSIYPWRGQYLYGAHAGMAMSWFDLLHRLFVMSSTKLTSAEESIARLSDEAGLQRMKLAAWSDVVGRQLAYYFESGRSTRPDKEIGERLRRLDFEVIQAYMKHVRDLGLPGHDMNKLEELFAAMNWPSLVSARKKRGPGEHVAYVETAADESR